MKLIVLLLIISYSANALAGSIVLDQKDAEVWHFRQAFSGTVHEVKVKQVRIHHNNSVTTAAVKSGVFSFELIMQPGKNIIWVESTKGQAYVKSESIEYKLMYKPLPRAIPLITIRADTASLRADVIENPHGKPLQFYWRSRKINPATTAIRTAPAGTASVVIPKEEGKYFFDLTVVTEEDSIKFTTYCIRSQDTLVAFSFDSGYSSWIDDAVIYEITPYKFVDNGKLPDITAKLAELKFLGINTIWLQPVYASFQRGQGYDVVDYFKVNPLLGNESELRTLIEAAKNLDMHVIFDMVPNHTSIHHPYARDLISNGKRSHYYDFYQKDFDGAPYASFCHKHPDGFVYYFWKDLVNLNFDNPEVEQWIIEICRYWVQEFGIDGFRFDAVWGINARKPSFAKRLRDELKSTNPDLLLLAEDKPSHFVYENGFDVAYDWTSDTTWVSQWSWQYKYDARKNFTVFNHPNTKLRVPMLADAIFKKDSYFFPRLRFMENNDLPRFIDAHSIEQTKMVAALLFSLPGVPMIYNGQEIGFRIHPYSKGAFFKRDQSIVSLDSTGLFSYYKDLIDLRRAHSALRSKEIIKTYESGEHGVVAFSRKSKDEIIYVLVNLSDQPRSINLNVAVQQPTPNVNFVDLLTREEFRLNEGAQATQISLKQFSTRILTRTQ